MHNIETTFVWVPSTKRKQSQHEHCSVLLIIDKKNLGSITHYTVTKCFDRLDLIPNCFRNRNHHKGVKLFNKEKNADTDLCDYVTSSEECLGDDHAKVITLTIYRIQIGATI